MRYRRLDRLLFELTLNMCLNILYVIWGMFGISYNTVVLTPLLYFQAMQEFYID